MGKKTAARKAVKKSSVLYARISYNSELYIKGLTSKANAKSDVRISKSVVIDRLCRAAQEHGILSV